MWSWSHQFGGQLRSPATTGFWDLRVAIQDAMGWEDYHLHEFDVIDPVTRHIVRIGIPDEEFSDERPTLAGWEVRLSDYLTMDNPEVNYAYDFGDGWMHRVALKGITKPDPETRSIPGAWRASGPVLLRIAAVLGATRTSWGP